jgi:hypothetical protein
MDKLTVQRSTQTPVVLIIFNRPHPTQRVFNVVREAKPQQLFVIADGARFAEEQDQCEQTRKIIEQVDWDCEVLTDFAPINLGCKQRIISGLNWVFSLVESAIILEDDCLPTLSFFSFCEELLAYYRHDQRIFSISGNNFQNNISRTTDSYYFCKYSHIWGWATWRRAWQYWDDRAETWLAFRDADMMPNVWADSYSQIYWEAVFNGVFLNDSSTSWDLIWQFNCWSQNGLSITPKYNLVSNIGFDIDGTYCKNSNNPLANLPTTDIWEIEHPRFVVPNLAADLYTFDFVLEGNRIVSDLINSKNQSHSDGNLAILNPETTNISELAGSHSPKQILLVALNWEQSEDAIYQELSDIIWCILNYASGDQFSLMIYANEKYFEQADQMLLALMMNLAVDPSFTNLIESSEPDITITGDLTVTEWEDLRRKGIKQIKLKNPSLQINIDLPFDLGIFEWQALNPNLNN